MSTPPPSLLSLPAFSTASISRLQSLYSDFSRQKQSNPDSYHANITWWRNALQEFVWSGLQPRRGPSNAPNRLTLAAGKDVVDALRISGVGKPLGIGSVVVSRCLFASVFCTSSLLVSKAELTLSKALIYLDQFLSSKESVYNPGWLGVRIVKYVVGKPLWWALESLGIVGDDEPTKEEDRRWWGDYVLMPLVEHAADSVQEKQRIQTSPGPSGSLYTFDAFRREFIGALGPYSDFMSEVDAKVLIRYLERDRRVVVVEKEVWAGFRLCYSVRSTDSADHQVCGLVRQREQRDHTY
jgi:charged multivesicular body protein 7